MNIEDICMGSLLAVIVVFFGSILYMAHSTEVANRECRIELTKQTKLDAANIVLICEGT